MMARRDHDDAHVRLSGPDPAGQADPILAGKSKIQNQQVGAKSGQFIIERLGATCAAGIVTHGAQGFHGHLAQHVVVFQNDDVQAGIHR